MSGSIADPGVKVKVVMEVRDNWYATFQESNGRLLAVGLYLPKPADGIKTIQLPWGDPRVPALLQKLNTRWHGEQIVGTIVSEEEDAP